MAKDPSVLFYTQDFLIGVSLLTPLQKGHYITLLCYQQQSDTGSLTLNEIQTLMGKDFDKEWPNIIKKFKIDEGGYYNDRMRKEVLKRKKFSASRSENRKKKGVQIEDMKNISKTYVQDMNNICERHDKHMENENENTCIQEGVQGEDAGLTYSPSAPFAFDQNTVLPQTAQDAAERNQFAISKNKNTDYVKSQWHIFLYERLNDSIEKQRQYQSISDLTSYFLNWLRNKKPTDGTNQQTTTGSSGKPGTSEARTAALKNWSLGGGG